MLIVYGIPNCDQVQKTIKWLNHHQIQFQFHDFRAVGLSKKMAACWLKQAGASELLNKRSTTWKNLSRRAQSLAENETTLVSLFVSYPTILKRPVIERNQQLFTIGFNEQALQGLIQ